MDRAYKEDYAKWIQIDVEQHARTGGVVVEKEEIS